MLCQNSRAARANFRLLCFLFYLIISLSLIPHKNSYSLSFVPALLQVIHGQKNEGFSLSFCTQPLSLLYYPPPLVCICNNLKVVKFLSLLVLQCIYLSSSYSSPAAAFTTFFALVLNVFFRPLLFLAAVTMQILLFSCLASFSFKFSSTKIVISGIVVVYNPLCVYRGYRQRQTKIVC